jgi:hypothetical protein
MSAASFDLLSDHAWLRGWSLPLTFAAQSRA